MRYGVLLAPRSPPNDFAQTVQRAEAAGFDLAGVVDSQSIFRELYATLGIVADRTEEILLGPTITTAVTRHPVVTASAICTLNEHSSGRAILGLGTGDSAVYTLGERPARLADIETVIGLFHALFRGESHDYEGTDVRLKWVEETAREHDIPVVLAAEGPKTLRLAGRVADGVIIGTGLTPEILEDAIERVNAGAEAAGRDPDEIAKWPLAKINIGPDRDSAVDEIKMALAASANHAFRFTLEGKKVPDRYHEPIRRLQAAYVPHEHEDTGDSRNRKLVDELGLTDYLADRFTIVGTAGDAVEQLRVIESVPGIDGVLLANLVEEDRELIDRMAEDILPAVQ